jgi:hypothetical protein
VVDKPNPAIGLKDILAAAPYSLIDGGTGWQGQVGKLTDLPDQMVLLRNTGGPSSELAAAIDYPVVQVLVRGSKGQGGYESAYNMATAIHRALVKIPSSLVMPELTMIVPRGHIQELGVDDKDRPMFSLNLQLTISYATAGHRD